MTEPHHVTDGEPAHDAAHHLSPTPILIGIGALLLYLGIEFRGIMLAVGLVAFSGAMLAWVREDAIYWHQKRVDEGVLPGRDLGWWGMALFLGTEVMLFGGLFAAFFANRAAHPDLWEAARPHLEHALPLVTANTLILLSSGFVMHGALVQLRKNNRPAFVMLLLATIGLGATFLGIQVSEYRSLMEGGITLASGSFGSTFYLLTGTHAFHVLTGLVFFSIVLGRAAKGQFDSERHVAVDTFAIYWHFVDAVWILLYFVVYVGVI